MCLSALSGQDQTAQISTLQTWSVPWVGLLLACAFAARRILLSVRRGVFTNAITLLLLCRGVLCRAVRRAMLRCAVQVSEQELGQELSGRPSSKGEGPNWPQMWMLLQQVAAQQQQQQPGTATAAAAAGDDAATQFEKHVREADGVALTPPPYPGGLRPLNLVWISCISYGVSCAE
jgi:hypothetical protein